jgi:peptidoglycan/LPS O-acetylase OafA/YrhL
MQSLNIQYNPRIDQLRWLAATLVFLFHFHLEYRGLGGNGLVNPWASLIIEGHTGVGLFFTLSGFLFMQIALHQRQIVYADFLRNRVLRIMPLYLLIFLVATSISRDKFQPQDLLYLFVSNLGLAPTSHTVITGAAWTVSLEFLFYLAFPFLARFAMERGMRYLAGWLVLLLFFKMAAFTVNTNSTLMYFSTFVGRFDQFLIGMMAAMFYARHAAVLQRRAWVLVLVGVTVVVWDTRLMHVTASFLTAPRATFWIGWSMLESGGWALLILGWVAFKPRLPGPIERVLNHGGKISFSFYLLHMGLLHLLAQQVGLVRPTGIGWLDAGIMAAIAYALTWALATLCYYIVEEPFLRLRRSYGAARHETKAAVKA